ncbi:hypothetical protein SBV1_1220001 [Verrucomicrobia bacterium]|nr:hypothetical protein SBV1_1220001 [Verrucomicrobiota bacterium]
MAVIRWRYNGLPQLYLFRQVLRFLLRSGGSLNYVGPLPLGAGHEDGTDVSFRWQVLLEPLHVGFLAREGNAGTGVNAELDHLEAVIDEKIAEVSGLLALLSCADREIKRYNQPAHFEFLGVHGR